MDWNEALAGIPDEFGALYAQAQLDHLSGAQQNPEEYRQVAEATHANLQATRILLDAMSEPQVLARMTPQERTQVMRLEKRWQTLAAGFYANSVEVSQVQVGVAPALVVAGVIAVSAAALAWSAAGWNYTEDLKAKTELQSRELDMRYQLAQTGTALPPSTVTRPSDQMTPENMLKLGAVVVGVGLGGVLLWKFV